MRCIYSFSVPQSVIFATPSIFIPIKQSEKATSIQKDENRSDDESQIKTHGFVIAVIETGPGVSESERAKWIWVWDTRAVDTTLIAASLKSSGSVDASLGKPVFMKKV
jgi:hypothetical protein